jgi:hypothetical protein
VPSTPRAPKRARQECCACNHWCCCGLEVVSRCESSLFPHFSPRRPSALSLPPSSSLYCHSLFLAVSPCKSFHSANTQAPYCLAASLGIPQPPQHHADAPFNTIPVPPHPPRVFNKILWFRVFRQFRQFRVSTCDKALTRSEP